MRYYNEMVVWQVFIVGLIFGLTLRAMYMQIKQMFLSIKKPAQSLATQRASHKDYSVRSTLRPSA